LVNSGTPCSLYEGWLYCQHHEHYMLHSNLIWHHDREISLFYHQYKLASIQTLSSLKTGTPPWGGSWWSSFRGEYICFRGWSTPPLRGGWINPWVHLT